MSLRFPPYSLCRDSQAENTIGGYTASPHIVKNNGVQVSPRLYLDFTGNVTVTNINGKTTINVAGGTSSFKGVLTSPPLSLVDGWTYINSTNGNYYIYYAGNWWCLASLILPGTVFDDSGNIIRDDSGNIIGSN